MNFLGINVDKQAHCSFNMTFIFDRVIIDNIVLADVRTANSLMRSCKTINRHIHENSFLMHCISNYFAATLEQKINFQFHRALSLSPVNNTIDQIWIDSAPGNSPFGSVCVRFRSAKSNEQFDEDEDANANGMVNLNRNVHIGMGANYMYPMPQQLSNTLVIVASQIISRFINPANVHAITEIETLQLLYRTAVTFHKKNTVTASIHDNLIDALDNFKHIVELSKQTKPPTLQNTETWGPQYDGIISPKKRFLYESQDTYRLFGWVLAACLAGFVVGALRK